MLKYKIKIRQALCSRKSVCRGACRMTMLESRFFSAALSFWNKRMKSLLLSLSLSRCFMVISLFQIFYSLFMVIVFDLCNYGKFFIILRMISSGVFKVDLISSVMKQMKIQILSTMMARI